MPLPQAPPATPLLEQLVGASDEGERHAALGALSDMAADSYGQDAANLAATLRNAGGLPVLVECMDAEAVEVQQCAMSLLGNLLTDVFDPNAALSLQLFSDAGGLASLQRKLQADFPINLFAAAALQNVTALDPEDCCNKLREGGCDPALAVLASSDDEQVRSARALRRARSPD